ncbi:MAG: hypothetical protein KIS82_12260, partial [Ferruginibacter sp.]|nr:hypothetical protein [Ferruginibacter sp.]
IPLLFLGGGVQPQTVNLVGSQTYLAATVLGLLGDSSSAFPYSKNMLSLQYKPWAWYSFFNGFGYVTPAGILVYDNAGKRPIEKSGMVSDSMILEGRALQQVFYNDFLQRGNLPLPN